MQSHSLLAFAKSLFLLSLNFEGGSSIFNFVFAESEGRSSLSFLLRLSLVECEAVLKEGRLPSTIKHPGLTLKFVVY